MFSYFVNKTHYQKRRHQKKTEEKKKMPPCKPGYCRCSDVFMAGLSIFVVGLGTPLLVLYLLVVCPALCSMYLCFHRKIIFECYLDWLFFPGSALFAFVTIGWRRIFYGYPVNHLTYHASNHSPNEQTSSLLIENEESKEEGRLLSYHFSRNDTSIAYDLQCNDVARSPIGKRTLRMIVISDTHGKHQTFDNQMPIESADLLIHCGDITMQGKGGPSELKKCDQWFGGLKRRNPSMTIIVVGGNHDRFMPQMGASSISSDYFTNAIYLENNGVCLIRDGSPSSSMLKVIPELNYEEDMNDDNDLDDHQRAPLTVFACPWSPPGSDNNAFQDLTDQIVSDFELFLSKTENRVDVLVGHADLYHCLPRHIERLNYRLTRLKEGTERFDLLRTQVALHVRLLHCVKQCRSIVHVCGHFHAQNGVRKWQHNEGLVINSSVLDRYYLPFNNPFVIDFLGYHMG